MQTKTSRSKLLAQFGSTSKPPSRFRGALSECKKEALVCPTFLQGWRTGHNLEIEEDGFITVYSSKL